MNKATLTVVFTLVACFSAAPAVAQGTVTQPRPQPPATPSSANVPVSKMAVIYSVEFQDPKTGIARFNNTLNKLNGEFQKIQDDLNQTTQRLKTLQDEITRLQQAGGATPAQIQAKIDTLDQQKRKYTRKGEDAKVQYQKRYQDLLPQLQHPDIVTLDENANGHHMPMIIHGSQTPMLSVAANIDS